MRLYEPLLPIPGAYRVKDGTQRRKSRRDAVAQAIAIFEQKGDQEREGSDDPLTLYLSSYTSAWLSDTFIQGAYIREYHSWEREVKSYLNGQRHLNGEMTPFNWKPGKDGGSLTSLVATYLSEFYVQIDQTTMGVIDSMRTRVNNMKHDPSFFEDHLVSRAEYKTAANAIERFWNILERHQVLASIPAGPHIEKYLETI